MSQLTDEMVQTANHHLMELVNHLHNEFQEEEVLKNSVHENIIH